MSRFDFLGLSDRVTKALENTEMSMRDLLKADRQYLIDLPGIGATSADRILAALDEWVERSLTTSSAGDTNQEDQIGKLTEAAVWAKDVLYNLGGQRGMMLGGQMRMKIEAATGTKLEDEVVEMLK